MKRLLLLALMWCVPFVADAASLYLSPSSLSLSPGQTGTFTVYVESVDQAINAVSGTVLVDGATASGASKTGSIISFWAAEPSAVGGTVSFEGVALNGFTGGAGKVLSFTVRAGSTPGTYTARFGSGSVLANDGAGTNITSGTRGASVIVKAAATPAPAEPLKVKEKAESPSSGTPDAPVVLSKEFSSPDTWYAKSSGTFTWEIPSGVTGIRTLLDQKKSSVPSVLLDERTSSRTISDIPEGVNYLHVQFANAKGWGDVAHVRIAVDITPPSFTALNEVDQADPTTPRIEFDPTVEDETSGVAGLEASVNGEPYIALERKGGVYRTNPLPPGEYTLLVRAVDSAGNVSTARSMKASIAPIEGPTSIEISKDNESMSPITVTGTAPVPDTVVHIVFERNGKQEGKTQATVTKDGTYSAVLSEGLAPGSYMAYAYVEDDRGARSEVLSAGKVSVKGVPIDPTLLLVLQILGVIVVLMAVVSGTVWLTLALHTRITRSQIEPIKILREADLVTHKAFLLLRNDIKSYEEHLKRQKRSRKLTQKEIEFIEEFEKNLIESEQIIRKEIAEASLAAEHSRKWDK